MKTNFDEQLRFMVEGRGEFPFDMLRHSQAWPTSAHDANMLGRCATSETRRVGLTCAMLRHLSAARWESFSWPIVGGLDEYGYPADLAQTA